MKTCSVDGCNNKLLAKGLCRAHYLRLYKKGRLTLEREKGKTCSVPGCNKPYCAKGYCKTHYTKVRNSGTLKNLREYNGPCEACGCFTENGKYIKHKCYSCYRKYKIREKGSFYNSILTDRHRRRGAGDYRINFEEVAAKTNGKCHICGEKVDMESKGKRRASIDHVVPISKGGSSEFDNLLLSHLDCNIRKFNK